MMGKELVFMYGEAKMVYCRGCGKEIHETAPMCPHCGAPQGVRTNDNSKEVSGTIWVSVVAFLLAILVILTFFDDSGWDHDTIVGVFIINIFSTILGVLALNNKYEGRGVAFASIVISSFSYFVLMIIYQFHGLSGH
jgi:uncharacterized paraquat-inducible protein A